VKDRIRIVKHFTRLSPRRVNDYLLQNSSGVRDPGTLLARRLAGSFTGSIVGNAQGAMYVPPRVILALWCYTDLLLLIRGASFRFQVADQD
jgi:hypothetical protein